MLQEGQCQQEIPQGKNEAAKPASALQYSRTCLLLSSWSSFPLERKKATQSFLNGIKLDPQQNTRQRSIGSENTMQDIIPANSVQLLPPANIPQPQLAHSDDICTFVLLYYSFPGSCFPPHDLAKSRAHPLHIPAPSSKAPKPRCSPFWVLFSAMLPKLRSHSPQLSHGTSWMHK